jgi:hypothetical protein
MKKPLVLALALLAGCATTSAHTPSRNINHVNPSYPFLSGMGPMTGSAAVVTPAAPMQGRYGPIYTP